MLPGKVLVKAKKEKKDNYLQACLEIRYTFTTMAYYEDRTPVSDALSSHRRLDLHLSFKLK